MLKKCLLSLCLLSSAVAYGHGNAEELVIEDSPSSLVPPQSIRHFRTVDDKQIFLAGGRPKSDSAYRELAQRGITLVLSIQGGDYSGNAIGPFVQIWEHGEMPEELEEERQLVEAAGMRFINLPVNSLKRVDPDNLQSIVQTLKIVHEYVEAGGDLGRVFLHCAHGVDRTGLIVALYRVLYMGWAPDVAYTAWRQEGHSLANISFTSALDRFYFHFVNHQASVVHWLNDEHGQPSFCEYSLWP